MALSTKLGVFGVVFTVLSVLITFVAFPMILNNGIAKSVALLPGTDMRKAWAKAPIPVDFKIYLFNVTNVEQVHAGQKPILQEIGPFVYQEWKQKVNIVDYRQNDTVSFNMKNTFIFDKERTLPLTGNEVITIPHVAILSLVLMVERVRPASMTVINRAIPPIYGDPKTVFVTATVNQILFEGIVLNCTSTEFAPASICRGIKQNSKGLHVVGGDIYKFSFFGVKNGTADEGQFLVKRGYKDYREVGKMVLFNGEPEMNVWSGPECNAIRGTDSTIFPPFMTPGDDIVSFAPDLCRSLGAKYVGPINYRGISASHYTATLGDMSTRPEEKCFCPTPDTCLKRGAYDLSKCTGAPIVLTLPHFYETDPSYLMNISGLQPQKEKHQIYMNFEMMTGTPLGARKRLQFNIEIHSVSKITQMQQLPTALVPIFWVEEGLDLDQSFIDMLDSKLFRTIRIVTVVRWILLAAGVLIIAAAIYLHVARKTKIDLKKEKTQNERPTSAQVGDVSITY